MSVLLMRLAGPMQAWGASSRFVRRTTRGEPTKSGIIGMLAAATGRRRTDPIEDLVKMRFAVRTDQPGRLMRDFQTSHSLDGSRAFRLSERYYLSDAVFVAALEGDAALVEGVAGALREPFFPLYLGRRSCPPSRSVFLDLRPEAHLMEAIERAEWQASDWWKRRTSSKTVRLDVAIDSDEEFAVDHEVVRDHPVSFDPELRQYAWRAVARGQVEVENDTFSQQRRVRSRRLSEHDPFAVLGGA